MGNPHCKWVRDRLPLLAGDELPVADRRGVERHLIGCSSCRQHRVALDHALEVLHAVRAEGVSKPEAPSLWPELARQIRQSRRPAASPLWGWLSFRLQPALALGLGVLAAVGVAVAARNQIADARARMASAARPIARTSLVAQDEPAPSTDAGLEAPKPSSDTPILETTPTTRLGFDLDHGTPMGSDLREGKQPTY
jgi:anti-sigma factor RsiW